MNTRIYLCYIFILIATLTNAQVKFVLKGRVTDSSSNAVKFATIKLLTNPSGSIKAFAIADTSGYFEIEFEQFATEFYVSASAVSFKNKTEPLSLSSFISAQHILTIVLSPSAKALDEIIIKADPKIRQSGDTISFKAEAYKQGNESNLKDLFEKLPGFSVTDNGMLTFNGKQVSRILIEGDDLFGSNYNALMQNLSVGGIEKVDVIKNFIDQSDISNKIIGSQEQVVNLKFKKAKYLKAYGTATASGGLPVQFYETKADLVTLMPKSKLVIIGNSNSIGKTKGELLQKDLTSQIQGQEKFQGFTSPVVQNISQVNEIASNSIPARRTNFNSTHLIGINWQIRPSKKFFISGSLAGSKDFYSQELIREQNLFTPVGIINFIDESEIRRSSVMVASELQLNYTVSAKLQFMSETSVTFNPGRDRTSGLFQQQPLFQSLNGDRYFIQQQITINRLIDSVSGFKFRFYGAKNKLSQIHNITPPLYNGLISDLPLFSSFLQNASYNALSGGVALKYFRKLKKGTLNNELITNSIREEILSGVIMQEKNTLELKSQSQFSNNLMYERLLLSNKLSFTHNFTPQLAASLGLTVLSINLKLTQKDSNYSTKIYHWLLLPQAGVTKRFKNNGQLGFNYSAANQLPQINQLFQNSVLQTHREFIKGNSVLNSVVNHTASVNYILSDFIRKKFSVFSSASYSSRGIVYLNNSIISTLYTLRDNLLTDRRSNDFFFIARTEKYVKKIRSNVVFDGSVGRQYNFSLVNSILYTNRSNGYGFGLQIRSGFDKFFNFQARFKYNRSIGRNSSQTIAGSEFTNQQLSPSVTIIIKPNDFLTFDYVVESLFITDALGNNSSVLFHDFNFRYILKKDKFDIALTGRNLANAQNFSFSSVTPLSETTSLNRLLPRFVLAQLNYRF